MKIGILGGTFDPIHIGHLMIADYAKDGAGLDEVWFMPSHTPPHKAGHITDAQHRLSMVKAATASIPDFHVCELELELGGTSYTVDTVKALREKFPEQQFYWIIGGDMIDYLPQFDRIEQLAQNISFIGVQRPGYEQALSQLPATLRQMIQMVEGPLIDLSSSDIRSRIEQGLSVRFLVPEPVYHVIKENGLYGS